MIMAPKKSSYFKTFALFLLFVAGGSVVITILKIIMRENEFTSQSSIYILGLLLGLYFFYICRWLFKRLSVIEKDK